MIDLDKDNKDFFVEVAKGNVPKNTIIELTARNLAVGTVIEDCTPMSAVYVSPTTYRTVSTVSSSANDTAAGTGMRTMKHKGITINGYEEEVITLNGTTPVVSTKAYACILESEGETWGSGLANAGTITATSTTDLTAQNVIPIGLNEMYSGIFMCPIGYKAYLFDWHVGFQNTNANTTLDATLLRKKNFTSGWQYEDFIPLSLTGSSSDNRTYKGGMLIKPGRFIKTQVISSVTNSDCISSYSILLVKD